jgi:GNAT superfamily N-acetyltransferase
MPVVLDESLLGSRVVVRYRRSKSDAGPPLSDAVGELVELTASTATVLRRRGPVVVSLDSIVAVRRVQPDRAQILELELIASRGWRPATVVEADGWLLRADQGWTGRANSVLPARTPRKPLPSMLAIAAAFYADRGLPLQVQVPLPARALLDAELANRGWTIARPTVVLVGRGSRDGYPDRDSGEGVGAAAADRGVTLDRTPSAAWLAAYHYRGGPLPGPAVKLLTRHDCVRFATVVSGGRTIGIARGAVDDGWLGITAVEVDPAYRRRGVATTLMAALHTWAASEQAHRCYLQVDGDNEAAVALYARLGFTEHHRYHYRVAPAVP